LHQYKVYDL
jgi:hypothetical protein